MMQGEKLSGAETSPIVDLSLRKSGAITELYLLVRPRVRQDLQAQIEVLTDAVAEVLKKHDAVILQERIFAAASTADMFVKARNASYAERADGIDPTWLDVPENALGPVSGINVHAIAGCDRPEILSIDGRRCGRLLANGSEKFLIGCNLQGSHSGSAPDQATGMLARAEELLGKVGGTLHDVTRTWMWLGDILDWYDEFNRVRNELFAARGLLRRGGICDLPASTGIGIGPMGLGQCTMDFCAGIGGERPKFLLGASNQNPASDYGSAFSRAVSARTPAGLTVYASGTASIDHAGKTTHIGKAEPQIDETLENLYQVIRDGGARPEEIVQAIVYPKTPEVERIFREKYSDLKMPMIIAISDVCRDNLLFEVEATAMTE
jgi:enamine deaminase RidA (YjgF/YER057c/UK114 family)